MWWLRREENSKCKTPSHFLRTFPWLVSVCALPWIILLTGAIALRLCPQPRQCSDDFTQRPIKTLWEKNIKCVWTNKSETSTSWACQEWSPQMALRETIYRSSNCARNIIKNKMKQREHAGALSSVTATTIFTLTACVRQSRCLEDIECRPPTLSWRYD